jgi:hypothetical protein
MTGNLTINEIRERKAELAKQIAQILKAFSAATGLNVTEIDIETRTLEGLNERTIVTGVSIKLESP